MAKYHKFNIGMTMVHINIVLGGKNMMSNRFEGIKLEFEGLFYGGSYEIEVFSDGRLYYSFIENESIDIQKGCFQISQKEVMMFEELIEHFELLKNQGNYNVTEFRFGNSLLVFQKNGRKVNMEIGKNMIFEYTKLLLDKYIKRTKRVFLLDTYLSGTKYIRNFNWKIKNITILDLFREFSGTYINSIAAYNEKKEKVGYIPKEHSEVLARLIDSGKKLYALAIPTDEATALKIYMYD